MSRSKIQIESYKESEIWSRDEDCSWTNWTDIEGISNIIVLHDKYKV